MKLWRMMKMGKILYINKMWLLIVTIYRHGVALYKKGGNFEEET